MLWLYTSKSRILIRLQFIPLRYTNYKNKNNEESILLLEVFIVITVSKIIKI